MLFFTQKLINKAYDQSAAKRNTKPVLVERKHAKKRLNPSFGDNMA